MIEWLIESLRELGTSPSAEEVADILWLAQHIGQPSFMYARQRATRFEAKEVQKTIKRTVTSGSKIEQTQHDILTDTDSDDSSIKRRQRVNVHLPITDQDTVKHRSGYPVSLRGVAALSHARKLARELRPLKRRALSRTRSILDEEATIRQSADSDSLYIALRPAPKRWLDLVVVIDECSSMIVWRQTAKEFSTLLEQLGAFRTIEAWYIATDRTDKSLALFPTRRALATNRNARHVRQLVAPQGQRLVLIVSDCIGHAWHTGGVAQMIQQWSNNNLVGLIQVLPEYLWDRTALRHAIFVNLQAYSPGSLNEQLVAEFPWHWSFDEQTAIHLPLPIATLEKDSLAAWVSLVNGRSDWLSPGVILTVVDPKSATNSSFHEELNAERLLPPQELLRRFYASASPQAQKLAGYLAAMHEFCMFLKTQQMPDDFTAILGLNLPLIRIIQHEMMEKDASHAQLAEVICSGLLRQTTSYVETLQSEKVFFTFVAGVHEILLNSVDGDDKVKVAEHVANAISSAISKRMGHGESSLFVENPTSVQNKKISPDYSPVAQVALSLLKRLGGYYSEIARALEARSRISYTGDKPVLVDLVPTEVISKKIAPIEQTTTALDLAFFKVLSPKDDQHLSRYFVQPSILPQVLNPESTLVAALAGYGKSTLAFMARQLLQNQWLHVNLDHDKDSDETLTYTLLRQIVADMWEYIQANPAVLSNLQSRATAARYFLTRFSAIELDYLLTCLADDFPEQAGVIHAFRAIEPHELFAATANDTQRLRILCDCVQKLGFQGVIVWLDLSQELTTTPPAVLQILRDFFGSLQMVRQRSLHIKCLALPSVCHQLQSLRGLETLSVNQLTLRWTQAQLQLMVDRRLQLLELRAIQSLAQLIDPAQFATFLDEFSDVHSPTEWLILTQHIVEQINHDEEIPLSEAAWLRVRRAYCAERVPIRMDEQGSFWRGKQLLADLTPKKRALYPLIKYLYEHPGVQRTYKLLAALDVDETNLNTMISRVRKDHLEPFPPTVTEREDVWIYLITDVNGGGYELRNTNRS